MVVSLTNMVKDLVTSMDSLTVTQVVLVSRTQQLAMVESSNAGCSVSRGETTSIPLQTVELETVDDKWTDMERLRQLPANVVIPGGRIHFTSLLGKGTAEQPAHHPPALDFLKSYFTHNLGRRGNPPVLGEDLCMIMWRSGGNTPAMGQTVVRVEEGQEEVEQILLEERVSEEVEFLKPVPTYPVCVEVITHPTELGHSFTSSSHCCVRLEVVMKGMDEKGVLVQYRLEKQEKGAMVSGNTGNINTVILKDSISKKYCRWHSMARKGGACKNGAGCIYKQTRLLPLEKLAI